MKSYFAKLAARATLANVPVTSPLTAKKSLETLEESSIATFPPTSADTRDRRQDDDESTPTSIFQAPLQSERINFNSPSPETTRPSLKNEQRRVDPSSETQRADTHREPVTEIKLEAPSLEIDAHAVFRKEGEQAQTPIVFQPASTLTDLSAHLKKESRHGETESESAERPDVNKKDEPTDSGQSLLLRRADNFMERLFAQSKDASNSTDELEEESKEPPPRRSRMDEATQLMPAPRTQPKPEQSDEQPRLVIGRLTVEVTPPAPAPVAPQQRVVVVRGSRERTVLPSSRRFGLGQF